MADWLEYVKIVLGVVGYFFVAPALGWSLQRSDLGKRLLFAGVIVGTAFHADQITLTAFSVDHTGHTRGFEISVMVFCAIALGVAQIFGERREVKLSPPGFLFYLLFILAGASTLVLTVPIQWPSFLIDLESDGVWVRARNIWEAIVKFGQLGLVFWCTHAYIKSKTEIRWLVQCLAAALIVAGSYALYDRYIGGVHRVRATFDHSNSLGIWAYMAALPCLALSLQRSVSLWLALFLFVGYLFGVLSVIVTVSRASVVIVGLGSLIVLIVGVSQNRGPRGYGMAALFLLMGGYVVIASMDTIGERFQIMDSAALKDEETEVEDLRVVLTRQASMMLEDSVIGVGWNNYQVACALPVVRYVQVLQEHEAADGDKHSEETFYRAPTVESLYWYVLAETGYAGFAGFFLFMLVTLWFLVRNLLRYRGSWIGDVLIAVGVALAGVYLHSFLEKVLLQTKNAVLWLALLGMVSKMETIRRRKRRESRKRSEEVDEEESSPETDALESLSSPF